MQDKIQELSRLHPVPNTEKLESSIRNIDRIASYYDGRVKEGKTVNIIQTKLFCYYVNSLMYALTIMKRYRVLTQELKSLNLETIAENKTDSL